MPNVSASGGYWSFQNVGPLTTTFTAPTGCSTAYTVLGAMSSDTLSYRYNLQCTDDLPATCLPPLTTTTPEWLESLDYSTWLGYAQYYSPGIYCPSDWATVGTLAHDDNSSNQSGYITVSKGKQTDFAYLPRTVLQSMLEPSETMAFCCPSSMTPDGFFGCYSVLPDYTPTKACKYDYDYGSATEYFTVPMTTETGLHGTPTATHYALTVTTETDSESLSTLTAVTYMAMVNLVHRPSDLEAAATSTATASATNAAARVGSKASQKGVNLSIGVSALAMALGAAVVFMA